MKKKKIKNQTDQLLLLKHFTAKKILDVLYIMLLFCVELKVSKVTSELSACSLKVISEVEAPANSTEGIIICREIEFI